MSVSVYDQDELEGLWHVLGGNDELRETLGALGYANRAAYLLSYDFSDEELLGTYATLRLERPRPYKAFTRDPIDWSDNLLYNCISNSGSDFAPERRARELLVAACLADKDAARRHARSHRERAADRRRELAYKASVEGAFASDLAYLEAQVALHERRAHEIEAVVGS